MKNREKNVALVAAGIMLGATIAGPAAQAAESIMAQRSAQKIYVDGQQVQMEAYAINGANYVKLRDVGKAVGFNVSWDAGTGSVQISSEEPYAEDAPAQAQSGRIVTIPQSDENFVLKAGDRVRCDDGTLYEIKDMSRYDTNVFADGPLPPLPTATCDWSLFPQPALPKVEVKHYADKYGDDLFVTNLYELRRMEYTLRNALGREPDAWRGNQLLAKINLTIPPEYEPYTDHFWPWRESEITDLVHALPNVRYYLAAYDYYHNGIFQYTRYCVMSI